jgi:phage-related protein
MDDYQTYLNALQSSNYVTQINQFNKQVADNKRESDLSGGSFMTTEAIQEGLTKVVSAIRTKVSDTATGLINKASETAKDAISTAKDAATEATQSVIKAGQELTSGLATEAVQTGQQAISDVIQTGQQALADAVQTGQQLTSGFITDAVQTGQQALSGLADAVPTQEEALSMLSQQARQLPTSDLLPEGAGQIESVLPSAIAPAVDSQLTALHAQAMDSAFGNFQTRTGTQLTGGYEELSQSAGARFNQLSTDISDEFEESGDILGGATNTLLSGSIRFTPQISSAIDTATGALEQGLTSAQNAVGSIIAPGLDTASSSIASLASTASGALDTASSAVSSAIASGLSATSGLSSAVDAAADAVQSGITAASGIASDVASTAIETAASAATAGVDAVGAAVGSTVSEALGELGPIGLIVGGLAGGLTQLFEGAKEHANQVPVLNPAFQFL